MEEQQASQIGLYFLRTGPDPACFSQVNPSLAQFSQIDVNLNASLHDILFQASHGKKCVIVFTVGNRSDLATVVGALISLKEEIRERKVFIIAFLRFGSVQVETILSKSGCTEILTDETNGRAFLYKLGRYLKILEHADTLPDEHFTKVLKGFSPKNEATFQVEMTEAWTGGDDFWLFRKKLYAKKYQDFWFVELMGPSPAAGFWKREGEGLWRWEANAGFDFFDATPSFWRFRGLKPEYSWVIHRWAFISKDPAFTLENHADVYSRFHLANPDTLLVANNSEFALSIFPKIKDTYDKDYLLSAESKDPRNLQGALPPDLEIPWADRVNSEDLTPADWNIHDLKIDEPVTSPADAGFTDFPVGADAMLECGIKGHLKNYDVEFLDYDRESSSLTIGLDSALIEPKEIVSLKLIAENLNIASSLQLKGVVVGMDPPDEFGKTTATLLMLQSSRAELLKVVNALQRRQRQILSFFKQTKGFG